MLPCLLQIAAILASAAASSGNPMKPLQLNVEQQGKATVIRVIGFSDRASSVPYALHVTAGGNRSVQRGVAHLQPRVQATVATVRLVSNRPLSAKLTVQPGETEYTEQFRQP